MVVIEHLAATNRTANAEAVVGMEWLLHRFDAAVSAALRDYPYLLVVAVVPLLACVAELGFRVGRRVGRLDEAYARQLDASRSHANVLLSLMLGFSLALSLSRYDMRREQVVDEANAIGTARLRSEMLSEPRRSRAAVAFADYIEARKAFARAGLDTHALEEARGRSAAAQRELWSIAVSRAEESPTPTTALFVQSVNEVIDRDEERLAGLENRVPRSVWIMLTALAVLASFLGGLTLERRSAIVMFLSPVLFGVVTLVIADLDTPGRGFIRVEAASIERLGGE